MRRLIAVSIISGTFLLSGSSSLVAAPAAPLRYCNVVVHFEVSAKRSEISAMKSRVRDDAEVVGYRFVSRAEAWAQFRKEFPTLTQNIGSNPLPARLHVKLGNSMDPERFAVRYLRLKLRGVRNVTTLPATRSSCVLLKYVRI